MSDHHRKQLRYLAIGDSYTVGTSVLKDQSFPKQLKKVIESSSQCSVAVDVIARHGWTTTDLLKGIDQKILDEPYDFCTLWIGVNNQYDGLAFEVYVRELQVLIDTATSAVANKKERLLLISIPDYTYTPFAQAKENIGGISASIDRYNDHIFSVCKQLGYTYVNITDISREGLDDVTLVASDGLHLSGKAYKRMVQKILSHLSFISQ